MMLGFFLDKYIIARATREVRFAGGLRVCGRLRYVRWEIGIQWDWAGDGDGDALEIDAGDGYLRRTSSESGSRISLRRGCGCCR